MILVGTGAQAREYARVFAALGIKFQTIGNTEETGSKFFEWTALQGIGTTVRYHGVNNNLLNDDYAVVAVSVNALYDTTKQLIVKGVKYILVEKPGTLYTIQMRALAYLAKAHGVDIRIAYNRRFLNSVISAKTIADRDGLTKLSFCFGDDMDAVCKSSHPESVKRKWIVANSSHVIDAALFIGGSLEGLYVESVNPFRGSGYGAGFPISYATDWERDKRWRIDFETKPGERYYLGPIEKLMRCEIHQESTVIAYEQGDLKPGMEAMIKSFLSDKHALPTAEEQLKALQLYDRIGGYKE
jgi:predicted dehydrogenase